uniref:Uncharacterized protein n=1 Tax=Rhizophora mucronata TaxID=61149 RepID=A0A2P2QTT6_RHIMU
MAPAKISRLSVINKSGASYSKKRPFN